MLKKTITYIDFDGNEQTTEAYFNLTKMECVDLNLEFEAEGGLIAKLKRLVSEDGDNRTHQKDAIEFIRMLIDRAYGVRPAEDPSLFLKEDDNGRPLYKKFKQTAAYDAYVFALLSGAESLDEFADNVMPQLNDAQRDEAAKLMAAEGIVLPSKEV